MGCPMKTPERRRHMIERLREAFDLAEQLFRK
jgi:hypothetical protein